MHYPVCVKCCADLEGRAASSIYDRPLAAAPWNSYRYAGPYGGIAIGARDDVEALREAGRSLDSGDRPDMGLLERWDGERWVPAGKPRVATHQLARCLAAIEQVRA
jgi:hypothetical protein